MTGRPRGKDLIQVTEVAYQEPGQDPQLPVNGVWRKDETNLIMHEAGVGSQCPRVGREEDTLSQPLFYWVYTRLGGASRRLKIHEDSEVMTQQV